MSAEIFSTKIKKNTNNEFLSREHLFLDNPLTAVYVVSAYTDTALIDWLIDRLEQRGSGNGGVKFKIYLDESQSRFVDGSSSKAFLINLNEKISNAKTKSRRRLFSQDSGIFLVKRGSLFHSKLIITESKNKKKLLIGSLNFTAKAFDFNEEICLVQDAEKRRTPQLIKQAYEYIESLETSYKNTIHNKSGQGRLDNTKVYKVSENLNIETDFGAEASLIDYLMKGVLIHPSKSKTFNLYFNLKLNQDLIDNALKEDENISSLIESNSMRKSLSVMKMLQKLNVTLDNSCSRIGVKRFCIDTPLGWWCPPEKYQDLDAEMKKNNEEEKNKKLFQILREKRSELTEMFKDVVCAINEKIKKYNCTWEYENLDAAVSDWKKWYGNKLEKENDPIWFGRLNSKFTVSRVPNFADDPVACEEFENAFRISLENEISISGGSLVAKEVYNHNKEKFFKDI